MAPGCSRRPWTAGATAVMVVGLFALVLHNEHAPLAGSDSLDAGPSRHSSGAPPAHAPSAVPSGSVASTNGLHAHAAPTALPSPAPVEPEAGAMYLLPQLGSGLTNQLLAVYASALFAHEHGLVYVLPQPAWQCLPGLSGPP
jgi:hypothetical protein